MLICPEMNDFAASLLKAANFTCYIIYVRSQLFYRTFLHFPLFNIVINIYVDTELREKKYEFIEGSLTLLYTLLGILLIRDL